MYMRASGPVVSFARRVHRLAGVRYDVTWWESDRARAQVDARVKFYGFEDIHLHHADVYRSIKGPQDWCACACLFVSSCHVAIS